MRPRGIRDMNVLLKSSLIAGIFYIPSRSEVDPIVPRLKKGMRILPFNFTIGDEYPRYVKSYREVLMNK